MIDVYLDGVSLRKIEVKHNEQLLVFQNEKDETVALNVSGTELMNIFRQVKMRCESLNLIPMTGQSNCGAKMDEEGRQSEMNDWIEVKSQKPPENQVVQTKIDDDKGIRNETELIYYKGLWWFPDMSMYYTPTHWRGVIGRKDGDKNGRKKV